MGKENLSSDIPGKGIYGPSGQERKELEQLKGPPKESFFKSWGFLVVVPPAVATAALNAACSPSLAIFREATPTPTETPTPVPTATPEPTQPPTPEKPVFLSELEKTFQEKIANYQGDVALAVVDLQNEKKIIIKGEDEHLLGCTAKIFILLSVVRDLQDGRYPQEEVDFAIDQMMGPSNDQYTKFLLDKTGLASVNQTLKEIGAQRTTFAHAPNYEVEDQSFGWENLSTASDLALILTKVYRGEFFSRSLSDYAIENMTHSWDAYDHNIIIPKLLPPGTKVAHKIGFFWQEPNTYNDAGVVMAPKFSYVLIYLSQDNADYYPGAPDFGAELSKITYDTFAERYGK